MTKSYVNRLHHVFVLSLDVSEARVHLVSGEADHRIHAQTARYVIILRQLSGSQLPRHRSACGGHKMRTCRTYTRGRGGYEVCVVLPYLMEWIEFSDFLDG